MEKKGINENIIVAIFMVLVVVCLLVFVGFNPIKEWLSTPFVWDEPEDVGIYLIGIDDNEAIKELEFKFVISNESSEPITRSSFEVVFDGMELDWDIYDTIDAFDTMVIEETMSVSYFGLDEETYEHFRNTKAADVQLTYKTLLMENEEGTVVKNDGTVKIITIIAASLVLWLIGLWKVLPKWLRIILKTCGLPSLVVVAALILLVGVIFASRSGDSSNSVNESKMRDAQQRYKRAANLKAGAQMTGNGYNAVKAQEQMDRAMADMIGASGSSDNSNFRSAQERYNRAANHKAGAQITGNKADAARAQAQMDKALADMIKNK